MKRVFSCIFAVAILMTLTSCDSNKYKKAVELYEIGNYTDALDAFYEIEDYEDSANYIEKCKNELTYEKAADFLENENYEDAIALLDEIIDFKDSSSLRKQAKFGQLYDYLKGQNEDAAYEKIISAENKEFLLGISGNSPSEILFYMERSYSDKTYNCIYVCRLIADTEGTARIEYQRNGTLSSAYTEDRPIREADVKGPYEVGTLRIDANVISPEISTSDSMINVMTAMILYYMEDLLSDIPLSITPADLGFISLQISK